MSPLTTLAAASATVAGLIIAAALAYRLLLAVAVLTATLHPDRNRRADARRVLTADRSPTTATNRTTMDTPPRHSSLIRAKPALDADS